MICSGCLKKLNKEGNITCSVDGCNKAFHTQCSNTKNLTAAQKEEWACPECRAKAKRGGDNSFTPVRGSDNVTLRKKPPTAPGTPSDDLGPQGLASASTDNFPSLVAEIRCLRQELANYQADFVNRFETLTAKIADYECRLEQKEKENSLLKLQVSMLEDQLEKQSQALLRTDLEILGITETPNENPYHIVLTAAQMIGVKLDDSDLDHVTRVGPRTIDGGKVYSPRPLVVSFLRRVKREEFLKQAKSRKSLESKGIVGSGPERRVYVNERLSTKNRRLFRNVRISAKELGYKYCWFRNGSILIKKRDGCPAITVRSVEDIAKLSDNN